MRVTVIIAALCAGVFAALPARAYDTLEQDYAACTQGGGKISAAEIVTACTRLIDNSATENELVGFFYGLRAANNTDRAQNCADAHKVLELTNDQTFVDGAKQLIEDNC